MDASCALLVSFDSGKSSFQSGIPLLSVSFSSYTGAYMIFCAPCVAVFDGPFHTANCQPNTPKRSASAHDAVTDMAPRGRTREYSIYFNDTTPLFLGLFKTQVLVRT